MGSVGDSYDNAMAETVIGLYKTEVIRRWEPWRNLDAVEFATLEWVDWFNNRDCSSPSETSPPWNSRWHTLGHSRTLRWWPDSKQKSLRKTGAIQFFPNVAFCPVLMRGCWVVN